MIDFRTGAERERSTPQARKPPRSAGPPHSAEPPHSPALPYPNPMPAQACPASASTWPRTATRAASRGRPPRSGASSWRCRCSARPRSWRVSAHARGRATPPRPRLARCAARGRPRRLRAAPRGGAPMLEVLACPEHRVRVRLERVPCPKHRGECARAVMRRKCRKVQACISRAWHGGECARAVMRGKYAQSAGMHFEGIMPLAM